MVVIFLGVLAVAVFRSPFALPIALAADLALPCTALALVVLIVAIATRRSRFTLAAAVVGLAQPCWRVAPDLVAAATTALIAQPTGEAPPLKVLSVNLWDLNTNYAALETLLAIEEPDIVVAQEASGGWKAALDALAPEYRYVSGGRWSSDGNVAILSRFQSLGEISPWTSSIAAVRLELPERLGGQSVDVIGVHLSRSATPAMRRHELQRVAVLAAAAPEGRVIVAGDFNATPWSGVLQGLDHVATMRRLTHALPTWPTPARTFAGLSMVAPPPFVAIDHIYAGRWWQTAHAHRGRDIGSDHFPVVGALFRGAAVDRCGAPPQDAPDQVGLSSTDC